MLVELGHEFAEDMPIFPGLPEDKVLPHSRMSSGGDSNTTFLHHFLHNGTHVDAPYHFWESGPSIDRIPIEDFMYRHPLLIEKDLQKGQLLAREDLERYGAKVKRCDILLICTGYWKLRGDKERYCDDFPAVSEEAARFIRLELPQLKAVAIDTLSIENPLQGPKTDFKVHKTFLNGELYEARPLLIYEDVNLGKILGKKIRRIYAFPLRLRGLDASPVNMVAEI
jgi:kynurenine formamidase